ncbi:sugar ABC transporter substrate-binding protein [Streptomyces sp. NBC_00728]|jgi:ABC-type xylose transport system, periplasmic component|uniref:sugar ABC transporter substrate-binding protein n=1 Tax=Streptomyces sp. NBC_00728 TaxID=2903676 RepID=UPI003866D740
MRRIAISTAASTIAFSLAGCSALNAWQDTTSSRTAKGNDITVGVLMPEKTNVRYAEFDYPIIKKKVAELTKNQGETIYENAGSDASVQNSQMRKMIDERVDVILLDAVDSHLITPMVKKAKAAGIPVIAYDRLAEGPINAYISFDNELVGEVQGRALLEAIGSSTSTSPTVVMVNGSPTDPNAKMFKTGALSELSDKMTITKNYDTDGYSPKLAQSEMTDAIKAIGKDNITAVYSANDAMAGGIVKALENAGVTKFPPITGQDAELTAVQRIVTGEQYMTVYKRYADEAEVAAEAAVMKVQGMSIQVDALTLDRVDSPTNKNIPARLVPVISLTRSNIKSTVVADGLYTVDQICTATYRAACDAIGLK